MTVNPNNVLYTEKPNITEINKSDSVKNPNHYNNNGKQLWDVMPDMSTREEFLGYCKLNIIKYVNRYNKKNGIEDLRKCVAYAERMIRFLEEEKK